MTEPRTVVCYAPDKGAAYSQAVRPGTPKGAAAAVAHFLAECASLEEPRVVQLTAYRPCVHDAADPILQAIDQTVARFGPPDQDVGGGMNYTTGEPDPGGYLQWQRPYAQFAEWRDFIIAGEPWPRAVVGPVSLHATYRFLWRDPDGAGALSEQLGGHATPDGVLWSELGFTMSHRSSVSPELWFPYAPLDPRLADLVSVTTANFPAKLSARHFRVGTPSKRGAGYTWRRFDASGLVAA